MCRHFQSQGACTLGDKCSFAHGEAELRKVSKFHLDLQQLRMQTYFPVYSHQVYINKDHLEVTTKEAAVGSAVEAAVEVTEVASKVVIKTNNQMLPTRPLFARILRMETANMVINALSLMENMNLRNLIQPLTKSSISNLLHCPVLLVSQLSEVCHQSHK